MTDYLEVPGANNVVGVDRSDGFVTPFQPSATHMTHCRYSFRLSGAEVHLYVQSENPPTTDIDEAENSVLLGLVAIATQGTVEFWVGAGQWVKFVKVGSGTCDYLAGQEVTFQN